MSTATAPAQTADEIAANKKAADEAFHEAVAKRFLDIATASEVVADGQLDKGLLAKRCYGELKNRHVVSIATEDDDRRDPAKSSSKEELAETIFVSMPSASAAEKNEVEKAVREKCLAAVWDVTQTAERGQVQRLLRADNLILVRGVVFRGSNTIKSGLYVSTVDEVIVRELLTPQLERLRRLAERIEGDYEMITDRVPELATPMKAAIEAAVEKATVTLPVASLESGEPNGRKALGK
jgi:hypothetical protein